MDRILNKRHCRIKLYPLDINNHVTSLTSCLTRKLNEPCDFIDFFQNISDDENPDTFKINHTNYNVVRKILFGTKNDCSTGHDDIPIRYLKPVVMTSLQHWFISSIHASTIVFSHRPGK